MDVDEEAKSSETLDAYDPLLPLPATSEADEDDVELPPDMSDGETVSSNSNQSQFDFYIESDTDLLRLREAALKSRERRTIDTAPNSAAFSIDKDFQQPQQDEQLKKDDDDMDIVDSPPPPAPDTNNIDAALIDSTKLQNSVETSPQRQFPDQVEIEEGEYCSDSNSQGVDENRNVESELARLADLAEWVVVDECEDALESIGEQLQIDEPEIETEVEVEDAASVRNAPNAEDDDEEELLALRELLISNLRARTSAKASNSALSAELLISTLRARNSAKASNSAVSAEIDSPSSSIPAAEEVQKKRDKLLNEDASIAKECITEDTTDQNSRQSQLLSVDDNDSPVNIDKDSNQAQLPSSAQTFNQITQPRIISMVEFPTSATCNREVQLQDYISQNADSELVKDLVPNSMSKENSIEPELTDYNDQSDKFATSELAPPTTVSAVASAPNIRSIPSASSLPQQQQNRRRVVGLSSHELRNSSSTGLPTRRFVICLGESDSDSSGSNDHSESENSRPAKRIRSEAPKTAQPQVVPAVDDRARLQSLRHSVRDGATKLRAGLAAGRQELQQRRAKFAERMAEINEKRNAAARLRIEARRALELCAQLRKRSAAAEAELRRLESAAIKEQKSLRAREAAFKTRENRILAALNQSNLLRRVCPPTPPSAPSLDPFVPLCPFGLHGSCRDPSCEYQHLSSWRLPENASRGRPNVATNSSSNATVANLVSSSSIVTSRPNNNHRVTESSVSVKDFCDACERYVTVSGAHLRDDPRCQSCRPTVTAEQAVSVLHHFLCRLRFKQSRAADIRDCVAAAEAFANESTGQFPNHVGLVLHSLELRRLTKRPVPVALLKTLLNRVPNCGIVRRALRLQSDYLGQRQLLEFAFGLPELQRTGESLDLLQLALAHCRLMFLATVDHTPPQAWPSGPPAGLSGQHAALLQLYRLYWIATGSPPDLPTASLRSDTALLAELPMFFQLATLFNSENLLSAGDLRLVLVAAGILPADSHVDKENGESNNDSTNDSEITSESLSASICDWLISAEPACPFRHCLLFIVAHCLSLNTTTNSSSSSSNQSKALSPVYRLLAIRRACLPALPYWLASSNLSSLSSLGELLHNCGASSVAHWPDLAHSAVYHCLRMDNLGGSDVAVADDEAVVQLLNLAISASYGCSIDREATMKHYKHLLGLLDATESLTIRSPVRTFVAMDSDAQLFVVLNYARLLKLEMSNDSALIDLTTRLISPRSGIQLLTHIAASSSIDADFSSLCRQLRLLLRSPCPAAVSTAAARFVDTLNWTKFDDSASSASELSAIVSRAPDSLPLLTSVCKVLTDRCGRLEDACALCLDCARFHQPASPSFWLELALKLVQSTHPGAVRPQLDLLERGLQLLPLCRRLWLTALQIAESAGLQRTVDRLRQGMQARLGADYGGQDWPNGATAVKGSTAAPGASSASAASSSAPGVKDQH